MDSIASGADLVAALQGLKANPFPILAEGVARRNAQDLSTAEILLVAATVLDSKNWQTFYELGLLYERDRRDQAIAQFRKSLALGPTKLKTVERLVANLAVDGQSEQINAIFQLSRAENLDGCKSLAAINAFAHYVRDFPLQDAEFILEQTRGFMKVREVKEAILGALAGGTPFAMVRLGDGEGAWLHQESDEEAKYGALYQQNRNTFWDIWFGTQSKPAADEFYRTMTQIRNDLNGADIIGVPDGNWIRHEFNSASLRGYSGTLNALRLAQKLASPNVRYCIQTMHFELERNGGLSEAIKAAKRVGVFTCHPQMGDFLANSFGIPAPEVITVPGEPSRRHLHGDLVTRGAHFPDRFTEIMREIPNRDYSGYLFLVAGGILGKAYALALKKAGAVAVDIGSVADKLLGKKTRPQF
ncbi:hypothetical protein [Sphingobium sp. LF-16]|uniref:hypothetical protein n=1 Tax=Sphingobium sp. LF-16 TaxID=2185111 RepID=UPI0013DE310F|nr:hypothetical protein [Sphingobium sp. LF-16]